MTSLRAENVSVDLGGTRIVSDISIDIGHGQFVALVGPNGSGKTTLLRALYRALRPAKGTILIGADDLWEIDSQESARRIAVVAQESSVGFDFTAGEVAAMGLIPHKRGFESDTEHDRRRVAESLDAVGVAGLTHRPFNAMSGGERQRTMIARALVQESSILLLDEPTNHLDIHYQLDVLHRVRSLGLTTVAALHDLNLAAAWSDAVLVLADGRIVAGGPPHEALTEERVSAVFDVRATAFLHPITGKHQLLFDRARGPREERGA